MRYVLGIVTVLHAIAVAAASGPPSEVNLEALRQRGIEEGWTFTVGCTGASRRPAHELCGFVEPTEGQLQGYGAEAAALRELPSSFDWRRWGVCTPIKEQGGCGGCFAFAAIAIMESAILTNDGVEVDLSEQWVISCTGAGNCVGGGYHGTASSFCRCSGSDVDLCGDQGAVWEQDFPFVAWDAPCACPYAHPYCIDDWSSIGATPSVNEIKQAILDHGPVAVSMHAAGLFQQYSGGVFNACPAGNLDHSVVLVGWDDNQGASGVWFLRNSWGTDWGEDENGISWDPNGDGIQDHEGGYARIEYDCSLVGSHVTYVTYADTMAGVWVDFAHLGPEAGSFWSPYSALSNGGSSVAPGGVISIKSGSSSETITISKALTLVARGGDVIIGQAGARP